MPYTWGSTNLKIVPKTYSPPHSSNGLTEIPILPDGTTNPASVIQQAGRGRKIVYFEGFTTSYADYAELHDDFVALTQRTFDDGNESLTMIISDLSPATMITAGKYEYSMTLMEV
jgi:hypothetical protein